MGHKTRREGGVVVDLGLMGLFFSGLGWLWVNTVYKTKRAKSLRWLMFGLRLRVVAVRLVDASLSRALNGVCMVVGGRSSVR